MSSQYELAVSTSIYSSDVIFQVAYKFTDRCFIFLRPDDHGNVIAEFRPRSDGDDISTVVGDFGNELIDQELRQRISDQTKAIRELILSRAFADGPGAI